MVGGHVLHIAEQQRHTFTLGEFGQAAIEMQFALAALLIFPAAAQDVGADIMGVFHSHTHTDAYPSPTDVAQASDPGWHYVLVSLRDTEPMVRSYRIVDGIIEEEPVRLLGR